MYVYVLIENVWIIQSPNSYSDYSSTDLSHGEMNVKRDVMGYEKYIYFEKTTVGIKNE